MKTCAHVSIDLGALCKMMYCKSFKFQVGFISRISPMNCVQETKYHANILAMHCNHVRTQNPRNYN